MNVVTVSVMFERSQPHISAQWTNPGTCHFTASWYHHAAHSRVSSVSSPSHTLSKCVSMFLPTRKLMLLLTKLSAQSRKEKRTNYAPSCSLNSPSQWTLYNFADASLTCSPKRTTETGSIVIYITLRSSISDMDSFSGLRSTCSRPLSLFRPEIIRTLCI